MPIKTKKPLIDKRGIVYARRMVRELNKLVDGFYYDGQRYTRASALNFNNVATLKLSRQVSAHVSQSVGALPDIVITDVFGRTVCASRKPSR